MLVFHFDERSRVFRGQSSVVALPPSRRRGRHRASRSAIPANAVVNAPEGTAGPGQQWIASHVDRSNPTFPKAIWRLEAKAEPMSPPSHKASSTVEASPFPADQLVLTALLSLFARGRPRAFAREQAEALIRAWLTAQGEPADGKIQNILMQLLKEGSIGRSESSTNAMA